MTPRRPLPGLAGMRPEILAAHEAALRAIAGQSDRRFGPPPVVRRAPFAIEDYHSAQEKGSGG